AREHVTGQRGQSRVEVVAQSHPGQTLPPVLTGQRGDPGQQLVDAEPVRQYEVDARDVIDVASHLGGCLDDVEQAEPVRDVRGHPRDVLGYGPGHQFRDVLPDGFAPRTL